MDPNILHNISYGIYIVSSFRGDRLNGQIVNTLFQITSEPVTLAVSINKNNLTHEFIKESKIFSASILSESAPLSLIGTFGFKSGRDEDKFKDVNVKKLSSKCPVVLDYTIGYIEAHVIRELDCGTHTLFLGELDSQRVLKLDRPMTYDYYHQVKRGTTPKAAPTFIKEEDLR